MFTQNQHRVFGSRWRGIFSALLFALSLAAVPAQAQSWRDVDGRPEGIDHATTGVYIWHEGDTVHIVHNRMQHNRIYGEVTIGSGSIDDPRGFRDEHNRRFTEITAQRLRFRFDSDQAVDGIKFNLHDAHNIRIRVETTRERGETFLGRSALRDRRDFLAFSMDDENQDRNRGNQDGNRNRRDGDLIRQDGDFNRPDGNGNRRDGDDDDRRRYDFDSNIKSSAKGSWSDIAGRPSDIDRGSGGFFIWSERNGSNPTVHIVYHRRFVGRGIVRGRILVENGRIDNPRGFRDEQDNRFLEHNDHELRFHIREGESVDGVKFEIIGKTSGSIDSRTKMRIQVLANGRYQSYRLGSGKRFIRDESLTIH